MLEQASQLALMQPVHVQGCWCTATGQGKLLPLTLGNAVAAPMCLLVLHHLWRWCRTKHPEAAMCCPGTAYLRVPACPPPTFPLPKMPPTCFLPFPLTLLHLSSAGWCGFTCCHNGGSRNWPPWTDVCNLPGQHKSLVPAQLTVRIAPFFFAMPI